MTSDGTLYSFDDTDALLASLSSSSVPTLSPADPDKAYSSGKSSVSGYSPEEEFLFQDNWSNGFSSDLVESIPNPNPIPQQNEFANQFLDFGFNEQFEKPTFSNMDPSAAYISPRSTSSTAHSPLSDTGKASTKSSSKEPMKMKTPETHDELDDEDEDDDEETTSTSKKSKSSASSKVTKPKKDRSSHNIIEKKYRLNINSKIVELRNAVPSLRIAAGDTDMSINDLEGLIPASKINKASVLSKATEYIKHLEMKNANLMNENAHLKQLLGNFSPHQQQMFVQQQIPQQSQQQQQQIPQQAPQAQQQFQNFQPATDFNGQPLNMVSQHNPGFQMGVPGKVLMGGLATMVGQNLFNGGDYDFRGLSAFPVLGTPQFAFFVNIVKFFFVALAVCYVFVPGLFNTSTNSGTEGKKESSVSLSSWYALLKEVTATKVGSLPLKEGRDDEVLTLMNKELLASTNSCCFSSLLFLFIKLHTYKPTFEVSFAKLTLAKMLLSYSDLSKYFSLSQSIETSLDEISNQKVSTNYLRYFYKEFKTKSAERSEAHKRLLNLAVGLPVNTNCSRGIQDQGYVLVLKDERVIYDYKSLLVSIRANELFREVLLEHIDLTFNKSKLARLDDEELKEVKQEIWNKLILAEHLAPKKSIVDIRVQLFKSVLNEKYLDVVLKTIDEESKALVLNEKYQKQTKKSSKADDEEEEDEAAEEEELTESDLEIEEDDDEQEDELKLAKASNLDPKFEKLLSQDLFNALTSSSILKLIKNSQKPHSIKLLKYIRSNKSQITLLSFISMFKLIEKLPQDWIEGQKESAIIENLINQLRLWIGSKENLNFNDLNDNGLKLKREISDKLVKVNKALIASGED